MSSDGNGQENSMGSIGNHSSFDANKDSDDEEEGAYLVRGSSCIGTCAANMQKRITIYFRDYCGLICQVISPLVLVFVGLLLTSKPTDVSQSPERFLSTDLYPLQHILVNDFAIDPNTAEGAIDVTMAEFTANLPNVTSAFDITVVPNTDYETFEDFYNMVYDSRNSRPDPYPYSYGSYQLFHADKGNHMYQFNTFLNVTSQDVTGIYPQFLYTSILRTALDNPDFVLDVTTSPFPVFYKFIQVQIAAQDLDYIYMLAVAFSLIPCVIVSFVLNEREK